MPGTYRSMALPPVNMPVALYALLCVLSCTAPTRADLAVLDQIFDGSDESQSHVGGGAGTARFAQTFTVGIDGKLATVSAKLLSNDLLDFDIRRVVDGVPSREPADILGVVTRVTPVRDDWTDVDFTQAGIRVRPGDQVAMVLSNTFIGIGGIDWRAGFDPNLFPIINPTADYEGGAGYIANVNGDTSWRPAASIFDETDFFFRTFVHPIPEPSTAMIALCGVAGVLHLGRRRRQHGPLCQPRSVDSSVPWVPNPRLTCAA